MLEPYRIKSIEPINFTTKDERRQILKEVGFNMFQIKSSDVLIDLLTDSGTSALSSLQWNNLVLGDVSFAGCESLYKFEEVVKKITNHKHVLPTHQGRASERILITALNGSGKYFISNTFFDTARGNIELIGGKAIDILKCSDITKGNDDFKGEMCVDSLIKLIKQLGKNNVIMVTMTITNNSVGGQPVSMENIKQVSSICRDYNILFILDACRFATNAYFIKTREKEYSNKSILKICNEMFSYADGSIMSTKKDGLSNSGGWLSLNDDKLAEKCKDFMVLTYGGLSGRELGVIAQGLEEVIDFRYLEHRIKSIEYLGDKLKKNGVPIIEPTGGHGVYIDARRFAQHIPPHQFPGQSIACQIYLEGGIRTREIGSVMFGKNSQDSTTHVHSLELVRLALPHRVYTLSHLDYVVEVITDVYKRRHCLKAMESTNTSFSLRRHFTARFKEISE